MSYHHGRANAIGQLNLSRGFTAMNTSGGPVQQAATIQPSGGAAQGLVCPSGQDDTIEWRRRDGKPGVRYGDRSPGPEWDDYRMVCRPRSSGLKLATTQRMSTQRVAPTLQVATTQRMSTQRVVQPTLTYSPNMRLATPTLTPQGQPSESEEVTTMVGPPLMAGGSIRPQQPGAPMAPEVTAPHDPTQPSPQEPDYYVDPYSSAPPPAAPSEPSAPEPLLPEPSRRRIPWWAWVLGAAAVGGGAYLIFKE